MSTIEALKTKIEALIPYMDEKPRGLWAASEALVLGSEGIKTVTFATGLSSNRIRAGTKELKISAPSQKEVKLETNSTEGVRKAGGGRKKITDTDPSLMENLDAFIEPVTRVEPCSPLRWTSKSTSKLARALKELGSKTIVRTVAKLFHKLGYSLQSNQKTKEELSHRDRESQFQYINEKVKDFQHRNQPVVSVDTKKKELIGNYKNSGAEWPRKGEPVQVLVHVRLGKTELQKLATETGLLIRVAHLPPGTSKWNKIEHRRFCHIRENWRGRPLINREVAVNLISNTTTSKGLKLQANLDEAEYPIGKKISDKDLKWNSSILPNID